MNEFRNIKPCIVKYYEIPLDNINNISNITSKAYLLKTLQSETYFIKKTTHNALEKYHYLYNQGTNNILYPIYVLYMLFLILLLFYMEFPVNQIQWLTLLGKQAQENYFLVHCEHLYKPLGFFQFRL